MKFGERVVNIWASENNPHREGLFVRHVSRSGTINPGKHIEITDGHGEFWTVTAEAIKPVSEQAGAPEEGGNGK